MAKREGYAQQDSVVIIGYLVANDSSDLLNFGKEQLSVANIKVLVSYRDKYAPLVAPYHTLNVISTDMDGCFEVKLPECIFYDSLYFRFVSGNVQDFYFDFQSKGFPNFTYVDVNRCLRQVPDIVPICSIGIIYRYDDRNRPYYELEILRRGGIDNILKDIH